MLEKIGLPAKPSLRGSAWVVDASHCQGCSSQFTFINRKHHCRRCGGLFCNSCSQQRMVLRGQGDSPVRICDPCKKLEEAARFELRHGYKNRAAKGSSKMAKHTNDVLSEILGTDADVISSSESSSSMDNFSYKPKASSSASLSNVTETVRNDSIELGLDTGSGSPEALRQQAMEEKKMYRVLKRQGKSEEALVAFKRGKELERQAEAIEMSLRKNRKRALSLGNVADVQSKGAATQSSETRGPPHQGVKQKDDFVAELRELGWSDDEEKKPASLSLEGEFSSLLRELPLRTSQENGHGIDKTQVIALKRKALTLKREGKLAEAKEELKRAKVLERQLEEQELLAGAEESDDELCAIIHSMDDDDKEDDLLGQYKQSHDLDIGNLLGTVDHVGVGGDFDVTDEDMVDPEIAAALKSLGWTEDSGQSDSTLSQSAPSNREACLAEIHSLKREALNLKRAGNVAEAMATLKKAKLLEKELEASDMPSKAVDMAGGNSYAQRDLGPKFSPKSRLVIQKELLAVKKRALALRREGRLDEAEEELKKGTVLQNQLNELDNSSKLAAAGIASGQKEDLTNELPDISRKYLDDDGEVDVTDHDLHDPKYLSLLRSLGWNDEDNKPPCSSLEASNLGGNHGNPIKAQDANDILVREPRRSKAEIQRELLGMKRKALALRRQGNADEAEEILKQTKALEAQMREMDSSKNLQADRDQLKKQSVDSSIDSRVDEVGDDIAEKDMKDPALLSVLKDLGWEDEEPTSLTLHERPSKQAAGCSTQSTTLSVTAKSKGQIQRELLDLKRKALTLRRKGETGEAEELLRKANALEAQMAELEAPKNEHMLDASRASSSQENVSHVNHGNPQNAIREEETSNISTMHDTSSNTKSENQGSAAAVTSPNYIDVDLVTDFAKKETKTDHRFLGNDTSICNISQPARYNYPLLGEFNLSDEAGAPSKRGIAESGILSQPGHPESMVDLLTGEYGEGSQIPTGKVKGESKSNVGVPSLIKPLLQTGSSSAADREAQSNDNTDASAVQNVSALDSQHSLRQEILVYKRKAVALKREGKLIEAKDTLRKAKLLEKSLDGDDSPPKKLGPDDQASTMQASSAGRKENSPSSSEPKALSGRDRFKLQQESLSHKRQALKLRREGRLQEAEAEFELAKALEVQLEESTSHESSKSEPMEDVVVEDFLDPQLLTALKAIGLDDAIGPSRNDETLGPAKASPEASKSNPARETLTQERTQLEERIKAEKVKAVNLKRAGKQGEALDALRRAKLYEKKLNALASN